jgi:hypothetical protein
MFQRTLFTLLVVLTSFVAFSQDEKAAGSATAANMFLELGGNGIFLSLNYDQRFSKKQNGLGGRLGIGFVPSIDVIIAETSSILVIPFGLNYLMGKGPNYFEAGAGGTFVSGSAKVLDEESKGSGFAFVPSIGYRYQPLRKGFTGRVILSPFISGGGMTFFAGVSGGVRF